MKKLRILLFSLLISFNSYGEWKEIITSTKGDTYYIDKDSIYESNGYYYYWELDDMKNALSNGSMSAKLLVQVDCGLKRYGTLTYVYYKQQMGNGEMMNTYTPTNFTWQYAPPESIGAQFLTVICA